jgi:adenine specific DNA methylase Mod
MVNRISNPLFYLKMMYPRLALMRKLLSEHGSVYVHIDWHVGHYVKLLLDEIFGKGVGCKPRGNAKMG